MTGIHLYRIIAFFLICFTANIVILNDAVETNSYRVNYKPNAELKDNKKTWSVLDRHSHMQALYIRE